MIRPGWPSDSWTISGASCGSLAWTRSEPRGDERLPVDAADPHRSGGCIGIDDAFDRSYDSAVSPTRAAADFAALFPEAYLAFHRTRPKGRRLSAQSSAVLSHLVLAGPLTVTELARHLSRSQSVCTEIVDQLEAKGLLARLADSRDRRRRLVWLTESGHALLAEEREVLSHERVEAAMARLPDRTRASLVSGLRALVEAASPHHPRRKS